MWRAMQEMRMWTDGQAGVAARTQENLQIAVDELRRLQDENKGLTPAGYGMMQVHNLMSELTEDFIRASMQIFYDAEKDFVSALSEGEKAIVSHTRIFMQALVTDRVIALEKDPQHIAQTILDQCEQSSTLDPQIIATLPEYWLQDHGISAKASTLIEALRVSQHFRNKGINFTEYWQKFGYSQRTLRDHRNYHESLEKAARGE